MVPVFRIAVGVGRGWVVALWHGSSGGMGVGSDARLVKRPDDDCRGMEV